PRQRAAQARHRRAALVLVAAAVPARAGHAHRRRARREVRRPRAPHALALAAVRAAPHRRRRPRAAHRTTASLPGSTAMEWKLIKKLEDVLYEKRPGIAKITINRPEVRNAFRPQTLFELQSCFNEAREDADTGVVILTGAGDQAFCSGGDQRVRGEQGYVGKDGVPRLNVLDLQKQIRSLPKPVVAMVAGYAIG